MVAFFAAVSHLSGSLRKHMLTLCGLWLVDFNRFLCFVLLLLIFFIIVLWMSSWLWLTAGKMLDCPGPGLVSWFGFELLSFRVLKCPVTDLRFLSLSPSLKECLWQALKSRDIDLVVSDHSPCTVDLKLMDRGDFMAAWGGISSVQYGECLIRSLN